MSEFVFTKSEKRLHEVVVRQPGVRRGTYLAALPVYARAVANLDAVRGNADDDDGWGDDVGHRFHVEVTQGTVDAFVSLVGPAPLSLEYGRSTNGATEPTYILTGAMGG